MRPQVFLATLSLLALLTALPLAKGSEEEGAAAVAGDANASPWPCCDQCDFCFRSNPPKCRCLDISYQGCHPACRNCVKYRAVGNSHDPVYRCADTITNYCERRCTPAAATTAA
ncbi:unnamed protein product [Urochloa decumbens]|uniref:Bowman-Birk serine protease inhibitors family domain-containing protein n=1 Tax=Urochloa decumbens TaxID=240449 RepID=A0ABC9B023_9POAL